MLDGSLMNEQSASMMDRVLRYRKTPIPVLEQQNWPEIRKMPIDESNEPLVGLDAYPERFVNHPEYYMQGFAGSLPILYTRMGVYGRLVKAAGMLPLGYKFVFLDTWRPVEVQQSLFDTYKARLASDNPGVSDEELTGMALKFVALPSFDNKNPSPHNTGGATDLTIADDRGIWLNMGTYFDEMTDRTCTRYYEEKFEKGEALSDTETDILENRRLLFHIMIGMGFTNYTDEWWHYDYGDQLWAWHNNGQVTAIYSRAKPTFAWAK